MTTIYQLNEMFNTIQGEGKQVGRPATFIRLQGCTVGCPWCDTKYTWAAGGTRTTVHKIIEDWGNNWQPLVVITGGEPTLYNLDDLIMGLRTTLERFYSQSTIQLETSGQNGIKGDLIPDWVTWSPKANLGFSCHKHLIHHVSEIKFVVDEDLTYEKVHAVVSSFENSTGKSVPVVLMPEGTPPKQENVEKAIEWTLKKHNWLLGDRLQWRVGIQ